MPTMDSRPRNRPLASAIPPDLPRISAIFLAEDRRTRKTRISLKAFFFLNPEHHPRQPRKELLATQYPEGSRIFSETQQFRLQPSNQKNHALQHSAHCQSRKTNQAAVRLSLQFFFRTARGLYPASMPPLAHSIGATWQEGDTRLSLCRAKGSSSLRPWRPYSAPSS